MAVFNQKKNPNYYTPNTAQRTDGQYFYETRKGDDTYVDPHTGSAYNAVANEAAYKNPYTPAVKPAAAAAKKNTSSGGSGGTVDPYADYRSTLDDLYNRVMGYGSYTPGSYSAKYDTSGLEGQLTGWMNEIDNYGDFEYDLNADMLYKQMADNYVQQGQLAMQDATANAAALTGGYGNSYAASVGNQAFQQHLTQLNNNIPALQQQALNVWQAGLDQLYGQLDAGSQQLNNLLALEAQNFAQWQANEQNAYNAWMANYNQLMDQYNLGVSHIGNLETYAPKSYSSSGSSSSPKKTSDSIAQPIAPAVNGMATGVNMLTNPAVSQAYYDLLEEMQKNK